MSAVAQRIPPLERTGRLTQARVLVSEWTKLRSVRSTKWALAAAFVLSIGLPALAAAIVAAVSSLVTAVVLVAWAFSNASFG